MVHELLTLGRKVDIQRSDGRVHSAMISGVNKEASSVMVEWFEDGEAKGKEIEMDQIFALNPELATIPPKPTRQQGSKRNATPSLSKNAKVPAQELISQRGRRLTGVAQKGKDVPPQSRGIDAVESSDENIPPGKQLAHDKSITAAVKRRSNCVKEVERLKKNRDERRQRQSEVREQRDKLQQELDPGNPNWEFLKMIREFQFGLHHKMLMTMNDPIEDHQICVCVRKRPLNKKEIKIKDIDLCTPIDKQTLCVHECKLKVDLTKFLENHKFRFDYAFDETSTNELVYRYTAKPLVETIFNQGMATCFAYGQTGSGKTHTMGGDFNGKNQGIYALAAHDVFKLHKSAKHRSKDLVISSSFFEIYSGKVFDLLNKKKKLRVLEDGQGQVQVVDLEEIIVQNVPDVLKLIERGMKVRTSGQTSANANSSRSHAVFQIVLRKPGVGRYGGLGQLYGKFSLIDLAGNERGADTSSSDRQTRMEGAEINKSLLALKECIRALGRKGAHLPFRASKLTQVLRDSFIGENAKTCMIATVSPGLTCTEHTLNTLRYADRVKELGPEGGPKKSVAVIDLDDDDMGKDQGKYKNAELAMLCTHSSNAGESESLYNFHEAVSLLIETEEQLIDEHKTSIEQTKEMLGEEEQMLNQLTYEASYDLEEYVQRLDDILTQKIDKFSKLKEKVNVFKEQLFEEERASSKVKRLPFV
eukprot:Seg1922.6 transcript_id=Seg1922.6/GoldUCD/mRNA.D3Y31 product="Kinesin-like protein KIF2A" protein_id=Seg1922.6/GoldUCD/D3Y31